MKDIEATISHANLRPTIAQLRELGVQEITVQSVDVYRSNVHQTMVHRGCTYEQDFVSESKLHFLIEDQDAAQAETIVARAVRH